ncbi:hypothetical protein [Limnohabitans sp.]|uniref:hypothetical protein n=1 Tax=Limnohabitans sp. TaxID=1907725 RepID=UPI0039BCC6ED|nr:hypothetical protein [Comamonadaceae bacterium]
MNSINDNAAPGPELAGSGDLASKASYEPDRPALAPAQKRPPPRQVNPQEMAPDRENPEPDCL